MIRLTEDQWKELDQAGNEPMRVVDPHNERQFILVSEAEFLRIQDLLADDLERRALANDSWENLSRLLKDEPW